MINSVELGNFLSHSETKLNFDEGVSVFVGQNGSGKSSVIDGITFALFGQHTRKSNKGLIRRGQSQGYAKINFSNNGKMYQAIRKIDIKGTLSSQFLEKKDDEWIPIAVGERKQFGESMTKKIELSIGLDFEKLKIASIVQQGELNSIIKAKPKEFKELINAVIGIDKLNISSENMKIVLKNFRESVRDDLGYDDSHCGILQNELDKYKIEIEENIPLKQQLEKKRKNLQKNIEVLKEKIETEYEKVEKVKQLESKKSELLNYAKEAILSIQNEITKNEKKILDCEGCFEYLNNKKNLEKSLEMIESSVKNNIKKIEECKMNSISLKEQQSIAKKLHLEDGKCPVCDSKVDHLNPLFQEKHLVEELSDLEQNIKSFEKEKKIFEKKKEEFLEKIRQTRDAEATLRAHAIKSKDQLDSMKQQIILQKTNIQKIPLTVNEGKLLQIATIDSHAKSLYENIVTIEKETIGFDMENFNLLKNSLEEKHDELSDINQELGGVLEKIRTGTEQIKKINLVLEELGFVKEYSSGLEEINENVFNRDGSVALSLRSWALHTISSKASEYLSMLNTKIQRIELTEKTRDVSITCYSKNTTLDLDSLSGGEQVCIALSLRLGMAQLLGASNLNFVILDEPTMHLDEERRKSLVHVLSQLSDITSTISNSKMQFIIITHDAEIFEDSVVEQIYEFQASETGTIVNAV